MNKINITVVSKKHSEHETYVANCLDDSFKISSYKSSFDIPPLQLEKPLLQPAQIVLFFTDEYDINELEKEVKHLLADTSENRLYSLLYVADGLLLHSLSHLMREDDDYIPTTFTPDILKFKVSQLIDRSSLLKKLSRDLHEASEIALLSMSNSSELGEISRFILSSYSCKTYEELLDALFDTIIVFGVHCSALIVVDDSVVVRLAQTAPPKTRKTMLKYHNQGRIHHFSRETIITFAHASLMIHNMPLENDSHYGRLLDNLTVLGNCFEARAKGIHSEQEADAASRAKTMFLATMSHELRTPMNSVIGFTERLIEKLKGRISEKEEKHLSAIKRNGDHLLSVINDILDVSKIEVGKMEIHPKSIDAKEQITNIFQQLQPIAQNKDLEFTLNVLVDELTVIADPKRFTQMVMNLVSNAIKYTPDGSVTITAEKTYDKEHGHYVCIAVEDTGIGISEEDQKRLFENFVQIDSELSRQVEGTGLGLAISMVFADMHGGRISVQSERNIGSCFSLYLPLPDNIHSPQEFKLTPKTEENLHTTHIHVNKRGGNTDSVELF